MGKKEDKTNVMRVLDSLKLPYEHFEYEKKQQAYRRRCCPLFG